MIVTEERFVIPLQWEVELFGRTVKDLKGIYVDYRKANNGKDPFDLGPHVEKIEEKVLLKKRYRQMGFPAVSFQTDLTFIIDAIKSADEEKILKLRKDLINIATWLTYNEPPEQQEMMIAS